MINIDDLKLMEVKLHINAEQIKRFVIFGNEDGEPIIGIADISNRIELTNIIANILKNKMSTKQFIRLLSKEQQKKINLC